MFFSVYDPCNMRSVFALHILIFIHYFILCNPCNKVSVLYPHLTIFRPVFLCVLLHTVSVFRYAYQSLCIAGLNSHNTVDFIPGCFHQETPFGARFSPQHACTLFWGSCVCRCLSKLSFQHLSPLVLFQAGRRLLPKGKVPLMLGVLDSIDFQGTDASVVLRDRTGKRPTW